MILEIINGDNIKKYDELDEDEKEIIDTVRNIRLMKDHAVFSLYGFQLADLIDDYEELINLRKNIQFKYFTIFEDIKKLDLINFEIDANLWEYNRNNENEIWKTELDLIYDVKNSFDIGIELIESGEAEKRIIDKENDNQDFS